MIIQSLQISAAVLILLSAVFHAIVNAIIKSSGDGLLTRGCMNAIAFLVALPFLWTVPVPDSRVWPILAVSVAIHALYPFFLVAAYRIGDLNATFPVARGSAPVFLALLSFLIFEQIPEPSTLLGVLLVALAISSFALDGLFTVSDKKFTGVFLALMTGAIIALYTAIDVVGLRLAPSPLTYIAWLFVLDGAFVALAVAFARRGAVRAFIRTSWKSTLAAGMLGVLTYGLALLALSIGPAVQIAAMRETSILFSALIGAWRLGEPFGGRRIIGAATIVLGIFHMYTGV